MGGVGGTERPKGPCIAGRCTRRAATVVKDPALSAARRAGLQLIAAGLAGSAAHPAYPGSAQIRRRAISTAPLDTSNADMLSHRRSCRPANGCTPERSGRASRRAAGFARVGGSCRPHAKSQTGPTASRSACGVTEITALWRASVSAANQCAPNTPAHLSDQKHGPSPTGQHQRSKPDGQDQRAWWRSHASAATRQRGVAKSLMDQMIWNGRILQHQG